MKKLLSEIRQCTICASSLPFGPNPILDTHKKSRITIIGQAPGSIVHKTGVPWDDQSGRRLRKWLNVETSQFYDPELFAIVPMGFCYPGKGKSGDLPPRPECAPLWHARILGELDHLQLIILIGSYAQAYYLKEKRKKTLTETVRCFKQYLPRYFVLPHPSPRNNIWIKKNDWFEKEALPTLKELIHSTLTA